MNKIKAIIFGLIVLFIATSCTMPNPNPAPSNPHEQSDKLFEEIKSTLDALIPDIYDQSLTLPTTVEDSEVTIEWFSSSKYITTTGQLIRPTSVEEVTLTCIITDQDNYSKDYEFKTMIYPNTLNMIEKMFINQFPNEITESMEYVETNYEYATVTWHSSDTSCFTEDGEYIRPDLDTEITISYEINYDGKITKQGEIKRLVLGTPHLEKIERVATWLQTEKITELSLTSDLSLPTADPYFNIPLEWKSSNDEVLNPQGKVTRYVFDRYVELTCKFTSGFNTQEVSFCITVEALDISSMTKTELLNNFLDAINVKQIGNLMFNAYRNISQSYNALNFFTPEDINRVQMITDISYSNRPGTIKPSTEFIVVHDTANTTKNSAGLAHANYVNNGGGGVSFHYVVGNDGAFHLIPDNEVAYHAGDGSRFFGLNDSGVKATSKMCNIGISSDGYYTFNGKVSKVKIPSNATLKRLTPSGIYYEVGPNGNWWINNTYFNTDYNYISNHGGNRNSIGIETCVDEGSDYIKTVRYNANLVAILLMENNLGVNRVVQHNNMSGKNCPYAMRYANYWQTFMDMVSLELFGKTHFADLTFEWMSKTEILSNDGYIQRKVASFDKLEYHVIVKEQDNVLISRDFETILLKPNQTK